MARYSVRIKASAAREIESIEPKKMRRLVVERIERIGRLADDPRPSGCEKLGGRSDRYRIRQRPYRVVYSIQDELLIVHVVKVGHRREVHRSR